nr:50S ribosomal protein L6 [Candidatus Paceibacterota bacterium]
MSRIGKKIIEIPAKTEVTSVSGVVTVKGPLGTLTKTLKPTVAVVVADGKVTLTPTEHTLDTLALWGTYS